jgi:hypothetical protein
MDLTNLRIKLFGWPRKLSGLDEDSFLRIRTLMRPTSSPLADCPGAYLFLAFIHSALNGTQAQLDS